jgi:hypothetical protein
VDLIFSDAILYGWNFDKHKIINTEKGSLRNGAMAIAKLKPFCIFVAALFLGTLYAGCVGLVTYPLRASLLSWPIWIILFWGLFWKFDLIRFSG